jgi:hydroxymethylglutaryl-CoA lyase
MSVVLTECPRDAMQGWHHAIPTEVKIRYLNQLLKVGFDVLDCGSFVSPKAIPQMADTRIVLPQLDLSDTASKLLVIVANERGAEDGLAFDEVSYLGFPFSISETFQKLNTNATIEESLSRVSSIQNLCVKKSKELVVYISMGFGNPYGDVYSPDVAVEWVQKLSAIGVQQFALSDTVGIAQPQVIEDLFSRLLNAFPMLNFGAHFHTSSDTWRQKMEAAARAGCLRYDGAIRGIGGCPMAQDELVGNMDMLNLLSFFADYPHNHIQLQAAIEESWRVFV